MIKQVFENDISWFSFIDNEFITAGFSTLKGGYSTDSFLGLNVGLNTTDNVENVIKNRTLLFNFVAPKMDVYYLNQVHSNILYDISCEIFVKSSDGDALFCDKKNQLLCVTIADCGSILFYDTAYTVIAAVHCGWKGTKDGVIENTIEKLSKHSSLENITACIGPMIHCENYEVGAEFYDFFDKTYFKNINNRLTFDLHAVIIDTLKQNGVSRIIDSNMDTYSNPDLFYSHRRNNCTGRMCAFIGLK